MVSIKNVRILGQSGRCGKTSKEYEKINRMYFEKIKNRNLEADKTFKIPELTP